MILTIDNNKKVDYDNVDIGCLIILENTFWSVFKDFIEDKYVVISLKTNELISSFETLKESKDYLRTMSVIEILKPNDFTLNIIRGE